MTDAGEELRNAARHGRNNIVEALLKENVDVNSKDNHGSTPLYIAALSGHTAVVETLLNNDACVDEASNDGETPLHIACAFGDLRVRCVIALVAAGADVHCKNVDGSAALNFAALTLATKTVPVLVAVGADLDAGNRFGETPRRMLASRGVQVDLSDGALERARRDIVKVRLDFVRHRAMQVCIGLQSLRLDALQLCEILQFACGSLARLIPFHQWWKIATTVKHFRNSK